MDWKRRALVVEDEPLLASLLCATLHQHGFESISSHSAVGAREKIASFDPDVMIIDINLGDGPNGLQFGQWAYRTHPHVAQVFLTRFADPKTGGGSQWDLPPRSSVIAKDRIAEPEFLLDALELALQGSSKVVRHDLTDKGALSRLTKTQFTVLQLAAQGLTNSAIALQRNVSERTVEQRLQIVYVKLGIRVDERVNARARAIRIFLEAGGLVDYKTPMK
ncbi:MAG: response regulator transcription factor [Pontimonas sp.]|nr:response regulator transcription factor [Pontimonas sp.]